MRTHEHLNITYHEKEMRQMANLLEVLIDFGQLT